MKYKKLLIYCLLLFPVFTFAQIGGEDEVYLNGDRVEAKFNGGGIEKFSQFVHEQFNYSKVTKAGQMIASFTVDVDGSVKNIKLIKMLDVESATEMIRVLNQCPKWEPAKRGGKPISIDIKYPMTFNAGLSSHQKKPEENEPPRMKKESPKEDLPAENNLIYNTAGIEKKPDFPGGIPEFHKYVSSNFNASKIPGFKGKFLVSFVVEKDGSLTNIDIIREIYHGTREEADRVLSQCPKWIPGENNGKKVRVLYNLPINISVP